MFVDYIANLPVPFLHHWGYWIIFLSTILETIPPIGLVIPGNTIVILGGFFAKLQIIDVGDVIWIAALGAVIGDSLGYYLGKRYGYSFLTKYGKYFYFKEEHYNKVKKLVNTHTGKTVILGRFNPLSRVFVPFIGGASEIPFFKFIFYGIIGAISWAASSVLLGFVFGASYEIVSKYTGRFLLIITIVLILIFYFYHFINRRNKLFSKKNVYAVFIESSLRKT